MRLGTQSFFGTTTFRTRHIYAACARSYKFTPSIAFIMASNVAILFWSIPLNDFLLWDSFMNASTGVEASAGIFYNTNVALY